MVHWTRNAVVGLAIVGLVLSPRWLEILVAKAVLTSPVLVFAMPAALIFTSFVLFHFSEDKGRGYGIEIVAPQSDTALKRVSFFFAVVGVFLIFFLGQVFQPAFDTAQLK